MATIYLLLMRMGPEVVILTKFPGAGEFTYGGFTAEFKLGGMTGTFSYAGLTAEFGRRQ